MRSLAAIALVGALVARAMSAGAGDLPALEKRALDRHMSDLTSCLAYYSIAQLALESAGDRATAARVGEIRSALLDRSFIVMRAVEMDQETALARQRAAVQEQMALIDNDLGNFATLTERYGNFCKAVVEDPEHRIEQWKDQLQGGGRE